MRCSAVGVRAQRTLLWGQRLHPLTPAVQCTSLSPWHGLTPVRSAPCLPYNRSRRLDSAAARRPWRAAERAVQAPRHPLEMQRPLPTPGALPSRPKPMPGGVARARGSLAALRGARGMLEMAICKDSKTTRRWVPNVDRPPGALTEPVRRKSAEPEAPIRTKTLKQ